MTFIIISLDRIKVIVLSFPTIVYTPRSDLGFKSYDLNNLWSKSGKKQIHLYWKMEFLHEICRTFNEVSLGKIKLDSYAFPTTLCSSQSA